MLERFALKEPPKKRLALVLANGAYRFGPLSAPQNDAQSIAEGLSRLGFDVSAAIDLSSEEIRKAIEKFLNAATSPDVVLLYYSGHGLQISGVNYMVPIDWSGDLQPENLVPLQPLIKSIAARSNTTLVFLDACRNNPIVENVIQEQRDFEAKGLEPTSLPKVSSGLADFGNDEDAIGNQAFIAFAAAPGKVALQPSRSPHSIFTAGLLKHIETVDLSLNHMMLRVSEYVQKQSGGRQQPWVSLSVTKPFYFSTGSLLWLTVNLIGIIGVMLSWAMQFYALFDSDLGPAGLVFPAVSLATFLLFVRGIDRSYRFLRGDYSTSEASLLERSLFGSFFGGVIASTIVTALYYFPLSDEVFQPRLQLVLAQVTTASILASLAIGSPSYIGASLLRRRSLIGRSSFLSSCAGGLSGGVLGGILLGPLLLTYFGEINRPISGPLVVIPGGLAGVSVVAFVLLSYDVANVSYRRLYSAIRAVATGAVLVSLCCVIIFLPFGQSIIGALREIYSNQDWFPLQFVGIIVGGIGGGILGSVIGISVARSEREVPSI